MSRTRRRADQVAKAFGRDPAGRAARDAIRIKRVRIHKDLSWRVNEDATVDLLTLPIRATTPDDQFD